MHFTELWKSGPKYTNGGRAFPMTADSILLADFAKKAERVLDIGCGSGLIGLLIAWNNEAAHITGVDISIEAASCSRDNFAANGLESRCSAIHGDILEVALPERSFDLIVCNPPYFEKGRGRSGGAAREESSATLREIIRRSSELLCNGGSLCLVLRPERLVQALEAMRFYGFSPSRRRFVVHTKQSKPSMVLLEGVLCGDLELEILPQLVLKDDSGKDSAEIMRIYRMTSEL